MHHSWKKPGAADVAIALTIRLTKVKLSYKKDNLRLSYSDFTTRIVLSFKSFVFHQSDRDLHFSLVQNSCDCNSKRYKARRHSR
jgi:hypothetical protein